MTLTVVVFAQAPQTFSYQTVIRDNNWQAVSNQNVSIEIAIIEDVASGTVVYKEVHDPTTNELGLVNLAIGSGGVMQGNWTNIDWGNHTYAFGPARNPGRCQPRRRRHCRTGHARPGTESRRGRLAHQFCGQAHPSSERRARY